MLFGALQECYQKQRISKILIKRQYQYEWYINLNYHQLEFDECQYFLSDSAFLLNQNVALGQMTAIVDKLRDKLVYWGEEVVARKEDHNVYRI